MSICVFFLQVVEYLEYVLSDVGISVEQTKAETIRQWLVSRCKTGVQSLFKNIPDPTHSASLAVSCFHVATSRMASCSFIVADTEVDSDNIMRLSIIADTTTITTPPPHLLPQGGSWYSR